MFLKIKFLLIFGILLSLLASLLELIFVKDSIFSHTFFYVSLTGQIIFLLGLTLLDIRIKALLSGYYGTILCLYILLHFFPLYDSSMFQNYSNQNLDPINAHTQNHPSWPLQSLVTKTTQSSGFLVMFITLFFFFLLFNYLRILTRVSNNVLFIRSFYVLIFCIFCDVLILSFNLIESRAVASFIIVFMLSPVLIMYVIGIFSLKDDILKRKAR